MRVFVTGGSGFVGSAVVDHLLARGHSVAALSHRRGVFPRPGIESITGDLFDAPALARGMAGADAVIHLVGIIAEEPAEGVTFERIHFEGARNVVDAARAAGVRRYVHMSALGTRHHAVSDYHKTKYRAERYVVASGLDWTIFRPSMIHGPGGEFMRMEADWVRGKAAPFLFMPYFGRGLFGRGGAGKLQPIGVNDVARAFVEALENPKSVGEIYPLAGTQVVTWPQLHRITARAVRGKNRLVVPIPAWYARLLTRAVPGSLLPFNRDQVEMSQEDNTADVTKFTTDFGWMPGGFEEQLKEYAGRL
jgi:NADH dehydrogenase